MKSRLIVLVALVFLACGCSKYEGYDKSNLKSSSVMLKVGGKTVFTYSDDNCQMSFNGGRKEFRVGTDTMSDYYVLSLSSIPASEMEVVTGDLEWTTSYDVNHCSGSFKLMKLSEDGTLWLWCAKEKIAVTVRILN